MTHDYSGKIPQTTNRDQPLYTSALSTPVNTDLTFKGGTVIQDDGSHVSFKDVTLQAVLVTVSQVKRIVQTEIQGRPGTVKEYIGMGDYNITIDGTIAGGNGRYPADEVRTLKTALDVTAPIDVVSRYLQALDIHAVVISDYTLDQEPGGYSQQRFTINCISDAVATVQII